MKHCFLSALTFVALGAVAAAPAAASARHAATLMIDAEFTYAGSTSAQAIEAGARAALRDIEASRFLGDDLSLDIRTSDNRGIAAIAADDFLAAADDPSVIAVMGGKHSAIVLNVVPLSAQRKLPLLAPWSSADAIVDNGQQPNWVFRLGLRDSWATDALARAALARGARRIGVMLINTSWARGVSTAMKRKAEEAGLTIVGERWHNRGETHLIDNYQELRAKGAEAVILAGDEADGASLLRGVSQLPEAERRPILAHWSVTGGHLARLPGETFRNVDLFVVQTFAASRPRTREAEAIGSDILKRVSPDLGFAMDSHSGLAHAYDLTWLLARAFKQAGVADRSRVRSEMEKLGPFHGWVKSYDRPFSTERHEALSPADVFIAHYKPDGGIDPVE